MATQANISRWKFRKATVASPATFIDIEEVLSVSGLGETNEQLDVTNFDSDVGKREFIAGLADGDEITIECNFLTAANGPQQDALKSAISAGTTLQYQVAYVAPSPDLTWTFAGVPISWRFVPSATEQNRVEFVVKISGAIT